MKCCKRCGIEVLGNREVCPLCNSVLHREEPENRERDTEEDSFPDIAAKHRVRRQIFWIATYVCVILEALFLFLNRLFSPGVRWSLITGVAAAYILSSLWQMLSRRKGHIVKIYFQAAAVFVLLAGIDYSLGFLGWSI